MKHLFHTLLLCGSLLALASCGTDDLLPTPDAGTNTPGEPDARPLISINATMSAGASANTRTGHNDVPDEGIKVSWAAGDQFAIHSLDTEGKSISSTTFTLVAGDAGKASATFEGKAPVASDSYLICYPANVQVGSSSVTLSLSRQKQTGNNSTAHLSRFDPMLGHTVKEDDFSEISFTPDDTHAESGHRAALMTFNLMNIPTDLGTPERIVLSTTAGDNAFYHFATLSGDPIVGKIPTLTLDLENVTAGQGIIVAYMMMPSVLMEKDKQLTIALEGSRKSYTFTAPAFEAEKTYERGMRYIADVNMWNEAIINYDGTGESFLGGFSGKGTKTDPYIIRSANNLKLLEGDVSLGDTQAGKYFKLTRDINIAMGRGMKWTPIGTDANRFKGHFDGCGHTISGEMTGNATHFGFFGYIMDATITNLHISAKVTGSDSSTGTSTGAITGRAYASAISNCTNAGAISGLKKVGGIVGYHSICTLINCTNTGTVTATGDTAGGIGGHSYNSIIVGCANTGSITAMTVGGIVGYFNVLNFTAEMYGCFNTGLVTATSGTTIGGVIGSLVAGTLSHCQYVPATGQSADLTACGGVTDNTLTSVAKLADLTTLNGAGVTALNEGITTWLAANSAQTCYLFEASSTPSTVPPVIARSGSISDIGGIGDKGAAW